MGRPQSAADLEYSSLIFWIRIMGRPGQLNPPIFATVSTVLGNLATVVSDVTQASPAALSATLNPHSSLTLIDYNLKPSYELKYNLSMERQLGGGFALVAGYVAARGVHLWRTGQSLLRSKHDCQPTAVRWSLPELRELMAAQARAAYTLPTLNRSTTLFKSK